MEDKNSVIIGTTCPALTNEDYDYHLSGDLNKFCVCVMNNKPCLGREIVDPDNNTTRFFSRGKCQINFEKIMRCPLYGVSADMFVNILKDKTETELNGKIKSIKK